MSRSAASVAVLLAMAPLPSVADTLRLRVNGVTMDVTHGRGVDADRLLSAKRAEFAGVAERRMPSGGWQLRARHWQGQSVALQHRGADESLEVLYSVVDIGQAVSPLPRVPVRLPIDVRVGTTIESLGPAPSTQWTLRTSHAPQGTLDAIARLARADGWQIDAEEARALSLSRRSEHLRVLASPAADRQGALLTLVAWGAR